MKDNTAIRAGDRFIRVGTSTTIWVVEQRLAFDGLAPHVRLAEEQRRSRKITLSESALLDDTLHHRELA